MFAFAGKALLIKISFLFDIAVGESDWKDNAWGLCDRKR
jgi:hypothetical protein